MRELLLDKSAMTAGKIKLAAPPEQIDRFPDIAKFRKAYGAMMSYCSAIDAAGYATEAEMKAPDATIQVQLCEIGDDGSIKTHFNGKPISADVDAIYNDHYMLSPFRLWEAVALSDLALKATSIKEKGSLIGLAAEKLGREVLVEFESTNGNLEIDLSFSGPGRIGRAHV